MLRIARKYHKWLMALIGLQFLIWSISGLYMVSVDIHLIHGESMIKNQGQKLNIEEVKYSIDSLANDYPNATNISLSYFMDKQVYRFKDGEYGRRVLDAKTGRLIPDVDEETAKIVANYYFSGESRITEVRLISSTSDMPSELSPRLLPVWQVAFANFANPTLYISQQTGVVVTKRHDFWRLFDWMWRFHIMDYDDGENVSNWFLLAISLLGSFAVFTGAVLTYYRIFRSNNKGVV